MKYTQYQKDCEKLHIENEETVARKNIKKDIESMKQKQDHLEKDAMSLKDQAKQLYLKAESQSDISFVTAGNALVGRAEQKQKDISDLIAKIESANKMLKA